MTATSKDIVRQWTDEIYTHKRFERIRDLAARQYIRHEPEGTGTTTPEEHEQRIRQIAHAGVTAPGPRVYTAVAEQDKVALLGMGLSVAGMPEYYYLQVFRVQEGKVVPPVCR